MNKTLKNTLTRVTSAAVGLPIYVYSIMTDSFQAIPILLVSMLISISCLYEFYKISDRSPEGEPFIKTGLIAGVILNILMYLFAFGKIYGYAKYIQPYDAKALMGLAVALVSLVLVFQVFIRPLKGGTYSAAVTVFGVIFIPLSFSHIILMKSLSHGAHYILLLNFIIMLNDTGAYFGGVLLGKHKAGFAASPNKSWEGYFSGLLVSVIAMLLANEAYNSFLNLQLFTMMEAVIGGVILSVIGSVGDLIESAVKRDGNVKDSGRMIPGHGGMWDVFDAMIFAMPIFYYYLLLKGVQ